MKLCFDFDGTLVEHNADATSPIPGPWKPGALECLLSLFRARHEVVIFSARTNPRMPGGGPKGEWYIAMRDMIEKTPELREAIRNGQLDLSDGTDGKPVAQWYFDDRGVGIGNGPYQRSLDWVRMAYGV